jgi:hypothetical protein
MPMQGGEEKASCAQLIPKFIGSFPSQFDMPINEGGSTERTKTHGNSRGNELRPMLRMSIEV